MRVGLQPGPVELIEPCEFFDTFIGNGCLVTQNPLAHARGSEGRNPYAASVSERVAPPPGKRAFAFSGRMRNSCEFTAVY
jgi:hypothetical protein